MNYSKKIRNTGKGVLLSRNVSVKQAWLEHIVLGLQEWANILESRTPQKKEEIGRKTQKLLSTRLVSALDNIPCMRSGALSCL